MKLKSLFRSSLIAFAATGLCFQAKATVLDFEDLSGTGALGSNYAGLTWTNWNYYDGAQNPYNASSGVQRIYNTFGFTATVQFGTDVTVNSLWMAGYNGGQSIEGWDDGVLVFTTATRSSDFSHFGEYYMLNWAGIDELQFKSTEGNYYIVDDIEYKGSSNQVPDSGVTLSLLGATMLGLVALRRSRR